jgi:hypothetical protein
MMGNRDMEVSLTVEGVVEAISFTSSSVVELLSSFGDWIDSIINIFFSDGAEPSYQHA